MLEEAKSGSSCVQTSVCYVMFLMLCVSLVRRVRKVSVYIHDSGSACVCAPSVGAVGRLTDQC